MSILTSANGNGNECQLTGIVSFQSAPPTFPPDDIMQDCVIRIMRGFHINTTRLNDEN